MADVLSSLVNRLPESSEFWAAILGAIVGGLITYFVERQSIRANTKQEWRRVQDEDLRAFQEAVMAAMDALETDLGNAHRIGLSNIVAEKWLPTDSHTAFQNAAMHATRIRDERVRSEWSELHATLMESKGAFQTAIAAANPENPLLQLISPEAQQIVEQKAHRVFDEAFMAAFRARKVSDRLWAATEEAFERVMGYGAAKSRRSREE